MKKNLELKSNSASETKKFGEILGRFLKGGDTVLLEGALGAGKTTLVQGIAKGFLGDAKIRVTSPTFSLIHEYDGGGEKIFHLDWYRLSSVKGEDEGMAAECLGSKNALKVIEWPSRGAPLLPSENLKIDLKHSGGNRRLLRIQARGKSYEDLLSLIKLKLHPGKAGVKTKRRRQP